MGTVSNVHQLQYYLCLPHPEMILPTILAASLLVLPGCHAQIYFSGNCPTVTVASANFTTNFATFLSTEWYENMRYYSGFEKNARCVRWSFSGTTTAAKITGTTTMVNGPWGRDLVQELTQKGGITGDFNYVMTKNPWTGRKLSGTYSWKILGSGADYVLAWSCKNKGNRHQEMLWVLTTGKQVTGTQWANILDEALTAGLSINQDKLKTVQQNC